MSREQDIKDLAGEAYRKHKIEVMTLDGVWRQYRCKRPGSWIYGFFITTTPGSLMVTGDIGNLWVRRVHDMFAWAPNACKSIGYFAEKCVTPTRDQYDEQRVHEAIADLMTAEGTESELAKRAQKLEDEIGEWGFDDEHWVKVCVHTSGLWDGCDFPDFSNWSHQFLWQLEAVKWFFANATAVELGPIIHLIEDQQRVRLGGQLPQRLHERDKRTNGTV